MPDPYESLNVRAQKRFAELKHAKGWTKEKIAELKQSSSITIDEDKLQRMLDIPPVRTEVDDIVHHINDKLDTAKVSPMAFLDSLRLSADLTIALAHILDYHSKGKKQSLVEAVKFIEKEIENG